MPRTFHVAFCVYMIVSLPGSSLHDESFREEKLGERQFAEQYFQNSAMAKQ